MNHLRAAAFLSDLYDQSLRTIAALVMFAGNLLFTGNGLRTAETDNPSALIPTLDDAGYNFAHAILVLLVNDFLLGIAHTLYDHLLGGLRGNTSQIFHFQTEPISSSS